MRALLLLFAAAAQANEFRVQEMAPATMAEMARADVPRHALVHRERPRGIVARAAGDSVAASVVVAPRAAPAPPPITRGFQAITDPLPGAHLLYDPPDVSAAVGPRHVVG